MMPSFSDRYSSYTSLFSFPIGLCLTVRSALSVKLCESMCVCVFVFMSVSFFYATLSSFSSQCASSSSVSQAFLIHFCDLQPILSHHPSAFSIPPFTLFILLHTSGNFMLFHLSIVHRLLPYLSILHNTWNHFFLFIIHHLFILSPLVLYIYHFPSPILRAGPPDRCGTNRPEACARSAQLQVTSVYINRQISPSIWERSVR